MNADDEIMIEDDEVLSYFCDSTLEWKGLVTNCKEVPRLVVEKMSKRWERGSNGFKKKSKKERKQPENVVFKENGPRDLKYRALEYLIKKIKSGEIEWSNGRVICESHKRFFSSKYTDEFKSSVYYHRFPVGCFKRPKPGATFGSISFMNDIFLEVIAEEYEFGKRYPAQKRNASTILQRIQQENPNRHDLPTLSNIDSILKSMINKQKKEEKQILTGGAHQDVLIKIRGKEIMQVMLEVITEFPLLKPIQALVMIKDKFKNLFPIDEEREIKLPKDESITTKWRRMQSALKRKDIPLNPIPPLRAEDEIEVERGMHEEEEGPRGMNELLFLAQDEFGLTEEEQDDAEMENDLRDLVGYIPGTHGGPSMFRV